MEALRIAGTVTADGELVLDGGTRLPAGAVEVIVLYPPATKKVRRRSKPTDHPAWGIWADRPECADPVEFTRQLRKLAQSRGDERE